MISVEQLREALRREPFQPFRLVMSSGRMYEVTSPEWMMVLPRYTSVGVPGKSGDGEVVAVLDNLHITEIVPLQLAESA